jgi:DNA-binding response OmpR family regulator
MHLLMVEDDVRLARSLTRLLAEDHHVVEHAATGHEGLELAVAADGLDLVILDIGLPDIDGLQVCRSLRADGLTLPILMLTARDAVGDRVAGLDAGADDYLVKPFAYPELGARLRALGRRSDVDRTRHEPVLRLGGIVLDEAARQVRVADEPVDLSQREFALLECLMRHPDQVLTRDQLLDHAWPMAVAVMPNTVDQYVSFVRRKLGPESERIETVRGVGYRMTST